MNILVADDDDILRSMLSTLLTTFGHTIETAVDGAEALEKVLSGNSRMVISDWNMPGLEGPDLCRAIRAAQLPGYIYIILLTGRGSTQDIVTGMSAGADDFITKPFQPAELQVRVRAGERILGLETRDLALFAMAKLVESRDPETGAHLERIRRYAQVLAEYLSGQPAFQNHMDTELVRLIYETSPLHDIGKVGIPDSVLLKPGRLSDREFAMMKRHTIIGAETLDAALRQHPGLRFLEVARDIALTHHEHFDGAGYPQGLKGENIPLAGRIVALADVYDALTARRVYKPPFAHDVARSIIIEGSGNHFDPAVVEAFLATEERFIAIKERFLEADLLAG